MLTKDGSELEFGGTRTTLCSSDSAFEVEPAEQEVTTDDASNGVQAISAVDVGVSKKNQLSSALYLESTEKEAIIKSSMATKQLHLSDMRVNDAEDDAAGLAIASALPANAKDQH